MKQLFPTHAIEYHFHLEAPAVAAPHRLLHQTLLQMARVLLALAGPGYQLLECRACPGAAGVEVVMNLKRRPNTSAPMVTEYSLAQRLDVILARELADCTGGRLGVLLEADGSLVLTFTIPEA